MQSKKKAFFYRINAGDLLAEVVSMTEKERGKWALSFAVALQKGDKEHSQYVSTLIDEANGYIDKKKSAAHTRWNAPHMQNDAPHMQTEKVHMPEAVTEAVQKHKTESKSSFSLPDWIDRQKWQDFVDMRVKIKKPMTDKAKALAVGKLEKMRAEGFDPNDSLDNSTFSSWQDLYPPKQNVVPLQQAVNEEVEGVRPRTEAELTRLRIVEAHERNNGKL